MLKFPHSFTQNGSQALADANDVFSELKRDPNVTYAALVPNQNGLERAFLQNVDEVNVFFISK